jgi:hypothetical protein
LWLIYEREGEEKKEREGEEKLKHKLVIATTFDTPPSIPRIKMVSALCVLLLTFRSPSFPISLFCSFLIYLGCVAYMIKDLSNSFSML